MQLTTTARIDVGKPRDEVFDFACSCETYVKLFRPRGMIAGVIAAEMIDGMPLAAGARRRMTLSDGAVIDEDVVTFDRPNRHVYRWSRGLRGLGKLIVRSGEGDWTFTGREGGTRIDWRYTFVLTSPLMYPLGAILLGGFRAWMEQQLRAIERALT